MGNGQLKKITYRTGTERPYIFVCGPSIPYPIESKRVVSNRVKVHSRLHHRVRKKAIDVKIDGAFELSHPFFSSTLKGAFKCFNAKGPAFRQVLN